MPKKPSHTKPPKDVYPEPTAEELKLINRHIKRCVDARNDELEESGENHRLDPSRFEAALRAKIFARDPSGKVKRSIVIDRERGIS